MENKKININDVNVSNFKISNSNVPKKNNTTTLTMNPQMTKLFITGMLKKGGMSSEKIKEALDIFDSKINNTNTKKEKSLNVEKDTKNFIDEKSSIAEKSKTNISVKTVVFN